MSTRAPRYRPPRVAQTMPALFAGLFGTDFLAVQREDAAAWWHACTRAQWSESNALASLFRVVLGGRDLDRLLTLFQQISPTRLVLVTEGLVKEGRLDRAVATRIEERIFTQTTPDGAWSLREEFLKVTGYKPLKPEGEAV